MPYGLRYHHFNKKVPLESITSFKTIKGVATKPTRPVIKRDQDGNIVARFKSLRLASEHVGKSGTFIRPYIIKGRSYQEFFYEYE